jgi:predicted phosphodiesterase
MSEKILVASDVHFPKKFSSLLINVLKMEKPKILVSAGDFFDRSFRINEQELHACINFLHSVRKNVDDFIYIHGDHDNRFGKQLARTFRELGILEIPKFGGYTVRSGRETFVIRHGNETDKKKFGLMSRRRDYKALTFKKLLPISLKLRSKLKLPPSHWLVTGHHHISGYDKMNKIIMLGTFEACGFAWLGNQTIPAYTYLTIQDGHFKLKRLDRVNKQLIEAKNAMSTLTRLVYL